MGNLGMQEIIVIFILALIIFGPRKLPELGKTLGKGLAEFKKASNELRQTWEDEVRLEKERETVSGLLKDTSNEVTGILNDNSIGSEIHADTSADSEIHAGSSAGSKEIQ